MQERGQVELLLELHELERMGVGNGEGQAFKKIEENLDASLMSRYRNLKKRKGTGVAVLKNGTCSGCMIIYPGTHEILRQKNFVHSCEYCGRLLVVVA